MNIEISVLGCTAQTGQKTNIGCCTVSSTGVLGAQATLSTTGTGKIQDSLKHSSLLDFYRQLNWAEKLL